MKIRVGFVANSSSSSFIGLGWAFESIHELVEKIKEFCPITEEEFERERYANPEYQDYGDYAEYIDNNFENIFKKYFDYKDITLHTGPDYTRYIACEIDLDDNPDTFIKNILNAKEKFSDNEDNKVIIKLKDEVGKPYIINETWYDG